MAHFDGRLRDWGPTPEALLAPLVRRVRNETGWVSGDPRFQTRHADVGHIVLRFPEHYPDHHTPARYTAAWPSWAALVAPIVAHFSAPYDIGGYGIAKIMLSRLAPGGRIPEHRDENPASRFPSKLHVPLITDPAIGFTIGAIRYHLACGRGYEINNMLPHGIDNRSDIARIHLIFEIYPLGVGADRNDLAGAAALA
jgi:hypothetical protein